MKHERKLVCRPVPDCPDLPQLPPEKDGWNDVTMLRIRSEIAQYGDDAVLGVTVYDKEGRAEVRLWMSSSQYGAQVFRRKGINALPEREPDRMYEASAESFYDIAEHWSRREKFYGDKEDVKQIKAFLDAKKGESITGAILRVQNSIKKAKRDEIHRRQMERIQARFAGIKEQPEAFYQWVIDGPMREHRYLFYAEAGKKDTSAVCSHCGKSVTVRGPHREYSWGVCPACGSRAQYRSMKRMDLKYGEEKTDYVATLEEHAGQILVRSYMVKLAIYGGKQHGGKRLKHQLYTWERYRHWIDPKTGKTTDVYKQDNGNSVVSIDGFVPGGMYDGYARTWIWPGNLAQLRKDTLLKYIPLEIAAEHGLRVDPEKLWTSGISCPVTEYLIKLGFYRLTSYALNGGPLTKVDRVLDPKGKNPAEVLRVEREDIPTLQAADPDDEILQIYRRLKKCGIKLTPEHLRMLDELQIDDGKSDVLREMMRDLSPGKALRYIRSQGRDGDHILQIWHDYIGMAKELGIDLKDKMLRFPKKLKVAHDEAAKVKQIRANAEIDAKVAGSAEKLEVLGWQYDGLIIRPARSQTELWEEGQTLHHCVGRYGYADKMVKWKTAIFFIREKNKPDVPYKTLELDLSDGHVIQCYGAHDKYPGDRVKGFYEKWQRELAAPFCRKSHKEAKTA